MEQAKRDVNDFYTMLLAVVFAAVLMLAGCSSDADGASSSASAPSGASSSSASAPVDYSGASVSYLGPEGTYTQEACGVFFGGQGTYLPQADVAASVAALLDGATDYAVIPQENTIGGPIPEYLDEIVNHAEVSIVGEVELPINQNLLAAKGAKPEDVKTVYSHKQGIAQGSDWLAEHVPQAEVVEVSSTAEGAKKAAEDKTGASAAIGSAAAADVYGLEVTAEAIQMNDANKTRFYVLSTGDAAEAASDRMAFVASGEVEGLAELLTSLEASGLKVVAVHDRPEKTELGRYSYLIECSGGGKDTLDTVAKDNPDFTYRYLGSFPLKG